MIVVRIRKRPMLLVTEIKMKTSYSLNYNNALILIGSFEIN